MKRCLLILLIILTAACAACSNDDVQPTAASESAAASTGVPESGTAATSAADTVQTGTTSPTAVTDGNTAPTQQNYPTGAGLKLISFTPLCQYPELPTGCEITSLTAVLKYYGVECDKCDISDTYLSKGEVGTVDFNKAFEGDPRDEGSYGCYANVIIETAYKYLAGKDQMLVISDRTGSRLSELYPFIDRNIPVIVWGTQNCAEGKYTVTWNVDGQDMTWFSPEHCMVLVGYDDSSVWVADPMYGDVRSYEKSVFERSYDSLFRQAIVIERAG